ncbi:MAG: MBL fold metallo-hydrolase [Erysipelotrichaceae bacterium]|nr:MBL fold metallo-hydrolase [Erysipelotrichaceae bacterium]
MKITDLVENTEGVCGCGTEHGLSLWIETGDHRIMMDTGASDLFEKNAEKLGIDLSQADIVIISHGHNDHGGGLARFLEINPTANVYIRDSAFGGYYSVRNGVPVYIGLDPVLKNNDRIIPVSGDHEIGTGLFLFSSVPLMRPMYHTNDHLKQKINEELVNDAFDHEQYLVVCENGMSVLFSGCAHRGILNILDEFNKRYGKDPDYVVSGFHTMNHSRGYTDEEINDIIVTAHELKKHDTVFFTCHCTGTEPYEKMKAIMNEQLNYLHCGEQLILTEPVV